MSEVNSDKVLNLTLECDENSGTMMFRVFRGKERAEIIQHVLGRRDNLVDIFRTIDRVLEEHIPEDELTSEVREKLLEQFRDGYRLLPKC